MKKSLALMLALIMVLCMIPTTAFAALNTGHKIDVRFTVLYVGDEFNIGYNYGASEKTQFVCQYSEPHSDTAYTNHTIAISDIKAAADSATVNSGYQIVGWSKESSANPTVWPLNKSGTTACNKGTTIYLVAKNPNPQPNQPTDAEIKGLVGSDNIQVQCTTANNTHPIASYSLLDGSYTTGAVIKDGNTYICTITVDPAIYVATYNVTNGNHTLKPDGQSGSITFEWKNNSWALAAGQNLPITFTVIHNTQEPPTPDKPEPPKPENTPGIPGLTGEKVVKVMCVTENSSHAEKSYQLIADSYDVGNVEGDATSGYTCTITVDPAKYVTKYNETNGDHTINPNPQSRSITFEWNNNSWALAAGQNLPITFTVVHNTQEPPTDTPNLPADIIKELVGSGKIQVQCTTANTTHPIESYSLLDESYTTGTVTKDGDAYTCTITVDPAKYVAEYNKTHGSHTLKPNSQSGSITFKWENDEWTLLAGQNLPITFTVVHDTQEPPTPSPSTNPNPTPTPTPGGGNGGGGHWHPTTTPVPVIVIPPKTGDMTIWQSILHFLGIR